MLYKCWGQKTAIHTQLWPFSFLWTTHGGLGEPLPSSLPSTLHLKPCPCYKIPVLCKGPFAYLLIPSCTRSPVNACTTFSQALGNEGHKETSAKPAHLQHSGQVLGWMGFVGGTRRSG